MTTKLPIKDAWAEENRFGHVTLYVRDTAGHLWSLYFQAESDLYDDDGTRRDHLADVGEYWACIETWHREEGE